MKCEYYNRDGSRNNFFTDVYGYLDNVAPEKRTVRKFYEILRDHSVLRTYNGEVQVVRGFDFKEQSYRLKKLDTIQEKFPGLITYTYTGNTAPMHGRKANKRFVVSISERVLKSIPTGEQREADLEVRKMEEAAIKIAEDAKRLRQEMLQSGNREDYLLDEMARRENKSESRFSNLPLEDIDTLNKKITKLTTAFAKVGIDVTTEFDDSLTVIAEVQPKQSDSSVVIKINPDLATEDTAFHEFGHVYLDLLGGMSNPVVQQAYEELKDTNLFKQVAIKYPELSGERLAKEVIATAIGIEGAKINTKNPSKIQALINRIFRAFSKMLQKLGIASTPSTASKLARDMFEERINSENLVGSLSNYAQQSKGEERMRKLIDKVKVSVRSELSRVYESAAYNEVQEKDREEAIDRLEVLQAILNNINNLEDFMTYVDYSGQHLAKMRSEYDAIIQYVKDNPKSVRSPRLGVKMYSLFRGLNSLDVLDTIKGETSAKLRRTEGLGASKTQELENLEDRLIVMIEELSALKKDFEIDIIPMMADVLLPFVNDKANDALQVEIDNIEKTGRWYNRLDKNTIEYKELTEWYKDPESDMSKEAYEERLKKLAIEQLRNKMITGRADMVRHLTSSYKDKSSMSVFFDPMIYDNERTLQLFVKLVDSAIQKANGSSLDFKYDALDEFLKFSEGKSSSDLNSPEKIFGEFLETITYVYYGKESKEEEVELLSIVQPIDLSGFNKARAEFEQSIKEKYNFPKREDAKNSEQYKKLVSIWRNTKSHQAYKNAKRKWNDENTEPVEDYQKVLDSYKAKIKTLQKIFYVAKANKNVDQMSSALAAMNNIKSKEARDFDEKTGKPSGNLVRPRADKYVNPKWEAIQKDPKKKGWYDWYVATYFEKQKLLGNSKLAKESWQEYSYQMPTIRKSTLDQSIENGVIAAGKDLIQDSFKLSEATDEFARYDSETGELRKKVPKFYTGKIDHKLVSQDMLGSLFRFSHMAHNYYEKNEINGQVNLIREIMMGRDVDAVDSRGRRVLDSLADSLGIRRNIPKRGASQRMRALDGFINASMYGEKEIVKNYKSINLNKVAGNLNQFVALTNLSLNALQIGNQFVLDNATSLQEGFAGQFFSFADQAWAVKEYTTSQFAALADVGKLAPVTKLGKFMEFIDGLQEVTDQQGNKLQTGLARRSLNSDLIMFGQHAVEHQTASIRALSVAHATKVKDKDGNPILNEKGEEANFYDMLVIDNKGKMSLDKRVDNVTREELTLLIRGLSRRTNQVKASFDKGELSRHWHTKMFGLFRNYLSPGARRRYGHGDTVHVDEELGTTTQGMYTTLQGLMLEAWDKKTANLGGIYSQMSPMEKENVKRISMELSSIIASGAIIAVLGSIDNDDENWGNNFLLYQATRYRMEMLQWVPGFGIPDLIRMLKSPAAAIRPIEQGYELLTQVLAELGYIVGITNQEEIFYQRATARFKKGDRKINKYIQDLFPTIRGINKSLYPEEALQWFNK